MDIYQYRISINQKIQRVIENDFQALDVDILKDELRSLYQFLIEGNSCRAEAASNFTDENKTTAQVEFNNVKIEESIQNKVEEPTVEKVIEPVVEEKIDVPIIEKRVDSVLESKTEPIAFTKKETEKAILNEQFQTENITLNQTLQSKTGIDLNSKISGGDLKSLIDLNKRFIIISELFKGDADAFSTAINKLNHSQNIEEAFAFITNELLPTYGWNMESQTTRMFDKLIRQKFGV